MLSLRKTIKNLTAPLHLDQAFRQLYVESARLGERLKFAVQGAPDPSTVIFLAGSGRSGTTWLQEVLCTLPGVQPIFEPFHPLFNARVRQLTGYDRQDPYFRAWYLPADEEQPEWTDLIGQVLEGKYRNYWTDYERRSWFPECFLIKDVRSNLYLGYLYQRFRPRMVYMLRHPCAVIRSRLTAPQPWYASVNDLLNQPLLLRDYLHPWVEEIRQETDVLGAHAVWWAVENRVALDQLRGMPHFLIYYEEMVLHPHETVKALVRWLGYAQTPARLQKSLEQPSRMSQKNLHYRHAQDRLQRWQQSLSRGDCRRILAWARRFGLTQYDENSLPVHLRPAAERA